MPNSFDPTPPAGWFARARYTPLADALRGELTACLDPRQLIAAASLPEPLPTLIYAVVRHSRLRRHARLHVTRELVNDFARQLAEGRTAVEIAGSFGVPERAASLIRQTTRTRPHRKSVAPIDHEDLLVVGLPAAVTGVIETVVRRSRLWRSEKFDVARELAAHFQDGLAAGRSADQLAAAFGPPEQAAKLIRQAKIRNRPRIWHAARFLVRVAALSVVAAFVLYGLLAVRMFSGSPEISHDYLREMNAERQVTADEVAWPLYREAIIKLGDPRVLNGSPLVDPDWTEAGPQGAHWPELVAAVERYQDSIRLTREGAQKPHLGYLLGNPEDHAAYIAAGATWLEREPSFADKRALIETALHGVQCMRELARLMQADARVAAAAGDGERTVADIVALLSMSQHLNQPRSFLVEQLVSLAIFGLALSDLGVILDDSPQIFSDTQLRELAHRVAAYRGGEIEIDFSSELMVFDDLLQRVYTDDGHGDGRLTLVGLEYLQNWSGNFNPQPRIGKQGDLTLQLMAPGLMTLVAGRAETREVAHKFVNDNIAAHQGPTWQWDAEKISAGDQWLKPSDNPLERFRYVMPMLFLPWTTHVFNAAERAIQQRDAAEVAIALVMWQRRHGAWPAALDDLVPDLLPVVPADRFDGAPLRYVVRDERPVLYSLGVDYDDDGGRPTKQPNQAIPGEYGPRTAEQLRTQSPDSDGDWILWPPVPPPKPAPDPLGPPAGDEN